MSLLLTGSDGLRAEARGPQSGPLGLALEAPGLAAFAPAYVAQAQGRAFLRARLTIEDAALAADAITLRLGDNLVSGDLRLARTGAVSGTLALPALDPLALAGWLSGPLRLNQPSWSGERFAAVPDLPELAVTVAARQVLLPGLPPLAGRALVAAGPGTLALRDIVVQGDGLRATGRLEGERQGAQLGARAALRIEGLDAASLLGAGFAGRATAELQLGASGESLARLVAGLGGSVQVSHDGLTIPGLAAQGLAKLTTGRAPEQFLDRPDSVGQALRREFDAGAWRLKPGSLPSSSRAG